MKAQRMLIPILFLAVAACGERVAQNGSGGSTTPPYVRVEGDSSLNRSATPVRIGEMGPGFAACNARGTVRERPGVTTIPVRAAPYESGEEIDRLGLDAEFFICSRTHDQRWFGIVYDEGGTATERCGVGSPAGRRQAYEGPCAAGWVSSATVRLVSGVPHQLPAQSSPPQ
jgi:hypothetical protein